MPKGIPKNGPRKLGCGRKAGPPTVTIAFRVPVEFENRIKMMVKNFVKEQKNQETK